MVEKWLSGKLEFGGQKINLVPPELTQEEIASVPGGAAAQNNLDSVQWEVLERNGGKMVIKADESKYWLAQGGVITEEFEALRSKHLELVGSGNEAADAESSLVAVESETRESEENPQTNEEKESLAQLEESPGVEVKVQSEVAQVELILAKDGSVWLLASANKTLNKFTQLGGFGTGQYVPAEGEQGLEFKLPLGDKSLVQLDEGSWKADGSGTSVISLYKLLIMCENEKHITEHKASYLTIKRKADTNLEGGMDGFDITYKTHMRFKCLPQDRLSGKNFFSKLVSNAAGFQQILPVFRFRFERVGATLKLQKPHIITKGSIQLKAGKPMKIK